GYVVTGAIGSGYEGKDVAPCRVGTYKAVTGVGVCVPAPAGSFVPTEGSSAAALCRPGTFSATTGAAACTPARKSPARKSLDSGVI
ncbi:MAG: hypothetical protein ACO3R6_07310, partial [Lutimaribacter sp.]